MISTLASNEIPDSVLVFGCVLAGLLTIVACTAMGCWVSIRRTRAIEETRREIAAYIAEGSMSPEQGERLMSAGDKWWKRLI